MTATAGPRRPPTSTRRSRRPSARRRVHRRGARADPPRRRVHPRDLDVRRRRSQRVELGDAGQVTAAEIDRPHRLGVGPDGTYRRRHLRRPHQADRSVDRDDHVGRLRPGRRCRSTSWSRPTARSSWREAQGAVVSRIAPNGTRTRVIGATGREGSSGDGGPAIRASAVEEPAGTAAADGTIYVAEVDGRRIRRVAPNGRVTTVGR